MAVWSLAKLQSAVETRRIDADYYRPEYLRVAELLSWAAPLKQFVQEIIHPAEFERRYAENGWRVVRTQNVRPLRMDFDSNEVFLSEEVASYLFKNHLRSGDILITRTGANFGQCSLYYGEEKPALATSHTFNVRTNEKIDSAYLALFLNTKQGRLLIDRGMYGSSQPEIAPRFLLRIPTPKFDNNTETELAAFVRKAYDQRKKSVSLFAEAQQIIESELGLDKLKFKKPVGYTGRFSTVGLSDAFNAGRIDAQCFSPNAIFYESWLRDHNQCDSLNHLLEAKIKGRQQEETEKGSIDYCSIKHISGHEMTDAPKCLPTSDTPLATQNNLLLAITGATIGKIGVVKRYKQLAFSGDLLCLKISPGIDPHYLLVVLDHTIGQVQFNRWITGSTNGHLAPRDVGRVLVPRFKNSIETRIAELVEESLKKRLESEKLLEQAKARVEQLIEEVAAQ